MGSGKTYHVVGLGRELQQGRPLYPAHTKLEIVQAIQKARRFTDEIEFWYAQTPRGCEWLNTPVPGTWITTPVWVQRFKVIACPVCGHRTEKDRGCGICNGSGITTTRNLKGYQPWQLKAQDF